MNNQKQAVVLVSGGMDSATAAVEAAESGYDVFTLHVSYGQRTETKEYECAKAIADHLDAPKFLNVETSHLSKIGASSLTDESMEVADADKTTEDIPNTYVPFRNANLLSMAVSYAEANECQAIFIGAHSEDFAGYPDCRPEFFETFQQVVDVGTKPETNVKIKAPFADWSKTDIAERGLEIDVPFDLTWSCYREDAPACGTCESCTFRLQAFEEAGTRDPIEYETRPV